MKFSISNCGFLADSFGAMAALPPEFGVEIQVEFGTEFYWTKQLKKVMAGRTGSLSIHGQFTDIDLAAEDLDENAVFDYFKWGFDRYNQYGASHFVIHPDGKLEAPATAQEIADKRSRAIDRIGKLSQIAKAEGVNLLVENLRPKGYGMIFDQEEFIKLFTTLPDVGCLIDTGHLRLSEWEFTPVISALADRIFAYHINDTYGLLDEHKPVGQGVIDWVSFFRDYKKYTPNAEMVLEYKGCTVSELVANANLIRSLMEVC